MRRVTSVRTALALGLAALGLAGAPRPAAAGPEIDGCAIFPASNVWNTRIDGLPLDPRSDDYVASIGPETGVHPDFGTVWQGAPIGIPYNVVGAGQPKVPVAFDYAPESDPGPYPVPEEPLIEGGPGSSGDRHILIVDRDAGILYELYAAYPDGAGGWEAGSGAVFDLRSNGLRPAGWTSADAAGLPILPGLVRYDEVAAGAIEHALRFTADVTRDDFIWPARHEASSVTDPGVPPMGQRFRLRADFDLAGYSPPVRVILQALKTYGMFLADNGSNWYVSGVPDSRWDDDMLVSEFATVHGADFEAVDESSLIVDPDSASSALVAGVRLQLPAVHFRPGEPCSLAARVSVPGPHPADIPLVVVLDVLGSYWFAPDWTRSPDRIETAWLRPETSVALIPRFDWPSGAGALAGVVFWGALADESGTGVMGEFDRREFGYGP